jgi:hypothetical protein
MLDGAVDVRPGLGMHGDDIGARFGERVEEMIDGRDHQMDVEGQGRVRAQRLHHHRADRQIGDIMAVHHVDMDPVGARGLDRAHLFAKAREIGAEDRRGNTDGSGGGGHRDRP